MMRHFQTTSKWTHKSNRLYIALHPQNQVNQKGGRKIGFGLIDKYYVWCNSWENDTQTKLWRLTEREEKQKCRKLNQFSKFKSHSYSNSQAFHMKSTTFDFGRCKCGKMAEHLKYGSKYRRVSHDSWAD